MSAGTDEFFIGWAARGGPRLRRFIAVAAVVVVAGSLVASLALSRAFVDPGAALFGTDQPPQAPRDATLTGVLTDLPYPSLWQPPDAVHPTGHTVLLSGDGKHGFDVPPDLIGRRAEVGGLALKRGPLDMLVAYGPAKATADPSIAAPPRRSLGRWQVTGEICDGKCAAGIMSPGTGLAHKACANLCLLGELPPVLVMRRPLEGHTVLLLADAQGRPLGPSILPFVAVPVALEGDVEVLGDLAILRTDLARARRL